MTAKPITPEAAARLIADGALLVDIREAQECAEVIEGAQNAPMSSGASGAGFSSSWVVTISPSASISVIVSAVGSPSKSGSANFSVAVPV